MASANGQLLAMLQSGGMAQIDIDTLMGLLVPMLGLEAYRTFETVKGGGPMTLC